MRRTLLVASALVGVACSLTNLDGFTSGGPHATTTPDGGETKPGSIDGGGGADATSTSEAGTEGGPGPSRDPYGDAVRADVPTSWWRFEETAGPTLHDEMSQHDGHAVGRQGNPVTIQFGVPGAVGRAAQLGNMAGYFTIGDVFDFAGSAAFTLEAWVKNDALVEEYEGIFNKRTDTSSGVANSGWVVFVHKGDQQLGFQFWKNTTALASVSTTLPAGFHHIVITATPYDVGVEYVLFRDGMPVDDLPKQTTQQLDTTANLVLGYGWNGALDEIAIYEHALAPERVAAHYQAAHP
jgi:hypothetical protein